MSETQTIESYEAIGGLTNKRLQSKHQNKHRVTMLVTALNLVISDATALRDKLLRSLDLDEAIGDELDLINSLDDTLENYAEPRNKYCEAEDLSAMNLEIDWETNPRMNGSEEE